MGLQDASDRQRNWKQTAKPSDSAVALAVIIGDYVPSLTAQDGGARQGA